MVDKKKQFKVANPDDEVETEVLARAIVEVSDAAKKLLDGRLTKRAVIVLIQDACPGSISRSTIEDVLEAAASLRSRYVK